ncbi:protein kinase family protein [Legionella clemsonensis]|uniref:Serine/threonine-protein kinase D n=1 Tax=Legionella clemsonensis TaxID=1867846 RepID=A0A222NZF3_9GAMM|nr:protein kinase family protein [Legionella clemsonensis]ASQ44968.1 Serine/threonine-protein kinase D [Legionella clemsonensis]
MPFPTINEINLPSAPLKVKLEDLSPEGRLLTKQQTVKTISQIESIKDTVQQTLKKAPFAKRFKKNELNIPYDILAFEDNYYAVYYGVKRNADLGIGGFGYVKLVQNIKTGDWAVLKLTVPDKKNTEYLILQQVELALGYLERHISKNNSFIELQKKQHAANGGISWWVPEQANLLMQLAEGVSLADLYKDNYFISANQWIEIILQVLKTYKTIKDKGIVHKDLKLENIFYCFATNKATIIDFGASRKKQSFLRHDKEKFIYSKGYTAPEIESKKEYSEASDIYALGATFFYLLHLTEPTRSVIKDLTLYTKLYSYCSSCMVNKNSKARPTTEEAILFFATIQRSLSNLLPKPFRKIGLFSVNEYFRYLNEARTLENENSMRGSFDLAAKDEQQTVQPALGSYFLHLLTTTFRRFYSFHPNPENLPRVEKSIENLSMEAQQKPERKRYDHSFITALQLFDEVWLIDAAKRPTKEYIQLRRELEKQRITVGQRCFLSESDELPQVIPAILTQLNTEKTAKHQKYFCLTVQADIQLPSEICLVTLQSERDEKYYQQIIEAYTALDIQEEYQRIKTSLSTLASQYEIAKNWIEDFDRRFAEGKLSLDYFKGRLKQLKKEIATLEKNSASLEAPGHSHFAFFAKLSKHKSPSTQVIKQIDLELDEWVSSYQM